MPSLLSVTSVTNGCASLRYGWLWKFLLAAILISPVSNERNESLSKQGETKMTTNQKPAHSIRLGRIKAAIWPTETSVGLRYNVTVGRLYKENEQWRTSYSFGRNDLPLVAKVLDQAHS